MTRPALFAIGSGIALFVAALIMLGLQHDGAARATMMAPVFVVAATGLPLVWYSFNQAQKLQHVQAETASQDKLIGEASAGIEELRTTIEKQLGAIEETAASLH